MTAGLAGAPVGGLGVVGAVTVVPGSASTTFFSVKYGCRAHQRNSAAGTASTTVRAQPTRTKRVSRRESTIQALSGFLVAFETPLPSDETWVACLPVGPSGFGMTSISNGLGDLAIKPGQASDSLLFQAVSHTAKIASTATP